MGKLILHGGKRVVLAVLICLAVFAMASSVFVGPVHAEGYVLVLKWGSYGSGDSQFAYPSGVAVDTSGNVCVTELGNDRVQKFTSTGAFITKWGSPGSADGQFNDTYGVAVDGSGDVYVTDFNNDRVQKFTSTGAFITKWGSSGSGDGQFYNPSGVAVDTSGNVYVADLSNHRIQKFTSTGAFVTKWGSPGSGDGQFAFPWGVAVDGSGDVYVTDLNNDRVQKFTSTGGFVTKWGSPGSGDGQFDWPWGVAVDGSGDVYVTDLNNDRVQKFTSTGAFVTKWGSPGSGDGQFNDPRGVAVDTSGNVYVVDMSNHRIQKFTSTLDVTPPTTVISKSGTAGDNNWFTSDVTVTLTASDTQSAVAETKYSLDGGTTWLTYTSPITITTQGNTAIQYYSVDSVGNKETTESENIKVDKLPPSIAPTTSLSNGTEIKSSTYEISWTATDTGSGIDHYEARLDSGRWANIGTTTTYTFTGMNDGSHTFNIKAVDKAGEFQIYSVNVIVKTSPTGGLGYIGPALIGGAAIGAATVAGLFIYKTRKRPKKPPTPTPKMLRIQAEPKEILADGKSTSTITLQLLDERGTPIAASEDIQVSLTSTRGRVEKPTITIPKGKEEEKTVLMSSVEIGPVKVSADAKGLKSITMTLNFLEKKRYCMHCGVIMPFTARLCPKCGNAPPAGVDTKVCRNCKSVIPVVAKFCSECGAGQPE